MPRPDHDWRLVAFALAVIASVQLAAAEQPLIEQVDPDRAWSVKATLSVRGRVHTPRGDGSTAALPLEGSAKLEWVERRLPPTSRAEWARRAVRLVRHASSKSRIDGRSTTVELRRDRRLVVVDETAGGLQPYCPDGPLTAEELELLDLTGDPLAALALLPTEPPRAEVTWQVPDRAVSLLTGLETLAGGRLDARLVTLGPTTAEIRVTGRVEGSVGGAAAVVELKGRLVFDRQERYLKTIELDIGERRDVGPAGPGLEITARVRVDRSPAATADVAPPRELAASLTRPPTPRQLELVLDAPGGVSVRHAREWQLFHGTADVVILRLIEQGRLIAQCNLSPVPAARPGEHTSPADFRRDVRAAIAERRGKIAAAEQLPGTAGRFVYRIVASGREAGLDMQWTYYLCAAPSGRQAALVFSVERRLLDRLRNRDRALVNNVRFLARRP